MRAVFAVWLVAAASSVMGRWTYDTLKGHLEEEYNIDVDVHSCPLNIPFWTGSECTNIIANKYIITVRNGYGHDYDNVFDTCNTAEVSKVRIYDGWRFLTVKFSNNVAPDAIQSFFKCIESIVESVELDTLPIVAQRVDGRPNNPDDDFHVKYEGRNPTSECKEEPRTHVEKATWGLERIYNINKPPYKSVVVPGGNPGDNTEIYIVATGINPHHVEFSGRAQRVWDAYRMLSDNTYGAICPANDPSCGQDEDGQGNFVASVAAGDTVGVAPGANVIGVKVAKYEGLYETSALIQGLNWACRPFVAGDSTKRIVMVAPFLSYTDATMKAFQYCASNGVIVVTAAGDNNELLDETHKIYHTIQSSYLLNVGASSITDEVYEYSNYGSVIDMFAPGREILGASPGISPGSTNSHYMFWSSTAAAAAHVAGAVAVMSSEFAEWDGKKIVEELIRNTLRHRFIFDFPGHNIWDTTPNRLLFMFFGECKDVIGLTVCTDKIFDIWLQQCWEKPTVPMVPVYEEGMPDSVLAEVNRRVQSATITGIEYLVRLRAFNEKFMIAKIDQQFDIESWMELYESTLDITKWYVLGENHLSHQNRILQDQLKGKKFFLDTQDKRIEFATDREYLKMYGNFFLVCFTRIQNTLLNPKLNVDQTGLYAYDFNYDGSIANSHLLFIQDSVTEGLDMPRYVYYGTQETAPKKAMRSGLKIPEYLMRNPEQFPITLRGLCEFFVQQLLNADMDLHYLRNPDLEWGEGGNAFLSTFTSYALAAAQAGPDGFVYVIDTQLLTSRNQYATVASVVEDYPLFSYFRRGNEARVEQGLHRLLPQVAVLNEINRNAIYGGLTMKTKTFSVFKEQYFDRSTGKDKREENFKMRKTQDYASPCVFGPLTDQVIEPVVHSTWLGKHVGQLFERHTGLWGLAMMALDNEAIRGEDLPIAFEHGKLAQLKEGWLGDYSVIWVVDNGGIPFHKEFNQRHSDSKTRIIKRYDARHNRECSANLKIDSECGGGEWRATHVAGKAAGLYTGIATKAEIVSVALGDNDDQHEKGILWMCNTLKASSEDDSLDQDQNVHWAAKKKHVIMLSADLNSARLQDLVNSCSDYAIIIRTTDNTPDGCNTNSIPVEVTDKIITVGSINQYGDQLGDASLDACIDVYAAGHDVLSAIPSTYSDEGEWKQPNSVLVDGCFERRHFPPRSKGGYALCSGPTVAAAHVAGFVANQLSMLHFLKLSPKKIKHMVKAASRQLQLRQPNVLLAEYADPICYDRVDCHKYLQKNDNSDNGLIDLQVLNSWAGDPLRVVELHDDFSIPFYTLDFTFDDFLVPVGLDLMRMFEQQLEMERKRLFTNPDTDKVDLFEFHLEKWDRSFVNPQRWDDILTPWYVTVRVRSNGIVDIAAWPPANRADVGESIFVDADAGKHQLAKLITSGTGLHTGEFFGFEIHVNNFGEIRQIVPEFSSPYTAFTRIRWLSSLFRVQTLTYNPGADL